MQHLINRQSIHIQLTKGADAFQIQQQLSGHYWKDVVPVITSLFDELSNNEEVIRIDRVEIDLGVLTEKEINQATWDDAILSTLRKQLYEKIGAKQRSPSIIREAKGISIFRQWLFYMQKGYLPWNAIRVDATWHDQVLETLAVNAVSINELRRVLKAVTIFSRRVVLQHKEDFLVKLVEILTAQNQRELPRITEALAKLFSLVSSAGSVVSEISEARLGIWLLLIREAARTEEQLNSQTLAERILLQKLPPSSILSLQGYDSIPGYDVIRPLIDRLKKGTGEIAAAQPEIARELEVYANKSKEPEKIESIDHGIFVQNAGVVLVHPFLSSFFKRLQLVKEGKFENIQAQQKAMYLIHYMATGRTIAEEYELPVAKVLCAWPVEMPVEKNIELSMDELNEADAMLQAAIEQWTVLKNTTVGGLREGFLQRSGKLVTKNNIQYLHVETQPIDVLLDQLPWVLSMLKLPWMKELLRVEWR